MNKSIHEYLIENKEFRRMWANKDDMPGVMYNKFSIEYTDFENANEFFYEISVAIEILEAEMRNSFIDSKYGNSK